MTSPGRGALSLRWQLMCSPVLPGIAPVGITLNGRLATVQGKTLQSPTSRAHPAPLASPLSRPQARGGPSRWLGLPAATLYTQKECLQGQTFPALKHAGSGFSLHQPSNRPPLADAE